jgi:hypothetical protein
MKSLVFSHSISIVFSTVSYSLAAWYVYQVLTGPESPSFMIRQPRESQDLLRPLPVSRCNACFHNIRLGQEPPGCGC